VGTDLPVEPLSLKLRKGEGQLKTFEKILVDEEKFFLDALGLALFPWPFLEFINIVKATLGAIFGVFWASFGLAQSNLFSPPVGSWVLLTFDYGTSWRNVKLVRVSLGHHNREPY
jgi:hypothetical protein